MNLPFAFSASLEAFLAYQVELTGAVPDVGMQELFAMWLPTINNAYQSGLNSYCGYIKDSIEFLENCIKENEADQFTADFLQKTLCWVRLAWEHGCKDAKKEAGNL